MHFMMSAHSAMVSIHHALVAAAAFDRRAWRELFIDPGDYRRTIMLVGTGRSGTTWIQNIIACEVSCRVMFEPFHSHKLSLLEAWNYRQYLRPEQRGQKFLAPADQILSGQVRNTWIDQFNQAHLVRRRLVKDIRANLILKWIRCQFPEIPIILLLRHPCAVARSKLALGWDTHLEDFLRQQDLVEDYLQPFVSEIRGASDQFDKHIFMWCIENYVPLRQFSPGEIYVAFYEHFCMDPQGEARSLLRHLGYPFRPEALAMITKPSAMSRADSAIIAGGSVLDSWRKHIDSRHITRANEILGLFGLDRIYGADSSPLVRGNEALRIMGAYRPSVQQEAPRLLP
jgi:hypothetical protein